ncbi:MAG: GumC family protein [Verrucomicrobiia bacterium]
METPKPSAGAPDTKLHFLDYWRIIRIRKTVILAVFLLVVLTTTAVTFILPESYKSTVRIEVGKDNPDIAPLLLGAQSQNSFDPYFIQTEFEKIKSKNVLNRVINELNLQEEWSKRFGAEGKLKTSEIYQLLVRQIDVRQSRNTSLIEISVFDENRQRAAEIANAIARVYGEVRSEARSSASSNAIKMLTIKLAEQEVKVTNAQARVDQLAQEQGGISDLGDSYSYQTLEPETVRGFERERISAEAMANQYLTLYSELKSKTPEQLAQSIPTALPDQELTRLLADLNTAEVQYAKLIQEVRTSRNAGQADVFHYHHCPRTDPEASGRRSRRLEGANDSEACFRQQPFQPGSGGESQRRGDARESTGLTSSPKKIWRPSRGSAKPSCSVFCRKVSTPPCLSRPW